MLDVEKMVEQYKAKGGTEDKIVQEILSKCDEERKSWLVSIISEYSDLSKLNFIVLVDIKCDKNINMKAVDKYVRNCLENSNDKIDIVDEYLKSRHQVSNSKAPEVSTIRHESKTKVSQNEIKCRMYPGSIDVETTNLVNGLYNAAKEWYGKEYEQRLKETINGTIFYECGENESCIDVEERFSGVKYPEEKKKKLAGVVGMTIKLDKGNGDYQPVVVYKKTDWLDYRATLAHELFYHQFCRQSNFEVENKEGKKVYRDGIALLQQGNEALNEGFADYNATEIMKIYTGNSDYKLDPRRLYAPLQGYAEQIVSCYDKKQLIDMITTGTPTIEELTKTKGFDFNTFSRYLDMYLRTQDFQDIEIADMFFNHFRSEHDIPQTQAATLRNIADTITSTNNKLKYPTYGTTGMRKKEDFAISKKTFASNTTMPNKDNIDDLETTLRNLNQLIRSMPKDWRDTND